MVLAYFNNVFQITAIDVEDKAGQKSLANLSQHENFDQLLLEAIDQGLSGLGEAGKASIYIYLESIFNIRKQEIPNKIDGFSNALKRIFGLGAPQLEILIKKKLKKNSERHTNWTIQIGFSQIDSYKIRRAYETFLQKQRKN